MTVTVSKSTELTLADIRHRAMLAKPNRVIERAQGHIAKSPSLATADALRLLTKAWYKLQEVNRGKAIY